MDSPTLKPLRVTQASGPMDMQQTLSVISTPSLHASRTSRPPRSSEHFAVQASSSRPLGKRLKSEYRRPVAPDAEPSPPPPDECVAFLNVEDWPAEAGSTSNAGWREYIPAVSPRGIPPSPKSVASWARSQPLVPLEDHSPRPLAELSVWEEPNNPSFDGEQNSPVFARTSWLAVGGAFVPSEDLVRVSNDDLQEASLRGDLGLVRRLIHSGASVNAPMRPEADDEFLTMLHILASKPGMPNGTRIIAEIIASRANVNARSSTGSTPLIFACSNRHLGAIEVLLDKKAHLHPINDYGQNAASSVVNSTREREHDDIVVEALQLLARAGADLDEGGDVPPMTDAVQRLNAKAVTLLLELGVTPTGLCEAVFMSNSDLVKMLIEATANPFVKDSQGSTVMDIALARGNAVQTSLLRDFIGDLQRRQHKHCETQHRQSHSDSFDDEPSESMKGAKTEHRHTHHAHSSEDLWLQKQWKYLSHVARVLMRHNAYGTCMFANLMVALFLPDSWVIFDMTDDTNLDIILCFVLSLFLFEFGAQCVGLQGKYINSFFFYMDLLGCISIPLDLSFFLDALPQGSSAHDAMLVRAARMAKVGTRAGRFTKLVKLLRFLPGMSKDKNLAGSTAKVISNTLNTALSIRVACLIIIMVMVMPFFEIFTFPGSDWSMKMWITVIADTCLRFPDDIPTLLTEMQAFYSEKDYLPYEVSCPMSDGKEHEYKLVGASAPGRKRNIVEIKEHGTTVHFNFQTAYRVDAVCNCMLIVTIITLMLGSAVILSSSISGIVITPLEKLLRGVKKMSSQIFSSVASVAGKLTHGDDNMSEGEMSNDEAFGNETLLLEKVLVKLAALGQLATQRSSMCAESLGNMNESDRAVLMGYCNPGRNTQLSKSPSRSTSMGMRGTSLFFQKEIDVLSQQIDKVLRATGLKWQHMQDWDFNVLELDDKQRQGVCESLFLYERGADSNSQHKELLPKYANFIDAAKAGYGSQKNIPYHNWNHGVDVAWMTHRMMILCGVDKYFGQHERFALMVSAVCHDIGHPGVNNPFLIETAHDLAIRYNDRSPLENMHCAKMFDLMKQPLMGVFNDFSKENLVEMRDVCIEAILHTDASQHFGMVKDLSMLYEMNDTLFDTAHHNHKAKQGDFPSDQTAELLGTADVKPILRNMILHLVDVSNPAKPWNLCQVWAFMVIDEFFSQGDRERQLGITVQALNDRSKVNKPYSQLAFIEFFVAPFVITIEKIVPPMDILTNQLFVNFDNWFGKWVEATGVDENEQAKVLERVAKLVRKHHRADG